ncbi:MAG: enterochelin esterase [Rhodospirillaceae bacterium]|nr:enterochelin esterase [Rhodospirillaceae bacterium]
MRPDHTLPRGRVERLTVDCPSLRGNPLDDPWRRAVDVYVPAGHSGAGLPLLVHLAAYTSSGLAATSWRSFEENLPERLDRLIAEGTLRPCVVACPDAFTRLGGNQYIDSAVMGLWETALATEILPAVETAAGCGGPGRRGLFGKSSGGYGALVNAMRRPEVWAAAACHAGDMGFEHCYLPEMPATLRALAKHDFSVASFMAAFEAAARPRRNDVGVLMVLGMAVSYDPDPAAPFGVRLPVDLQTCVLDEVRWANWRAWDPLEMAPQRLDALASLKALWIDCGRDDEYNLLFGARRLHRLLKGAGITHTFEEFEGSHGGIDHRLDLSLPRLVDALAA